MNWRKLLNIQSTEKEGEKPPSLQSANINKEPSPSNFLDSWKTQSQDPWSWERDREYVRRMQQELPINEGNNPINNIRMEMDIREKKLLMQNDLLEIECSKLKSVLEKLAEHLLLEKAERKGLDVVRVATLLKSSVSGDREIAIALVNDALITDVLELVQTPQDTMSDRWAWDSSLQPPPPYPVITGVDPYKI